MATKYYDNGNEVFAVKDTRIISVTYQGTEMRISALGFIANTKVTKSTENEMLVNAKSITKQQFTAKLNQVFGNFGVEVKGKYEV